MDPDPTAKLVPTSPGNVFAEFRTHGIWLEVRCWSPACERTVYYSGDVLVRLFGADTTVDDLAKRLVCLCGTKLPAVRAVVREWRLGMPVPSLGRPEPRKRREPHWPKG